MLDVKVSALKCAHTNTDAHTHTHNAQHTHTYMYVHINTAMYLTVVWCAGLSCVQGLVNEWNNKASEITGFKSEEMMGKKFVHEFILVRTLNLES